VIVTLLTIAAVILAIEAGMVMGWSLTFRECHPFNWRVFLGPWVYRQWACNH